MSKGRAGALVALVSVLLISGGCKSSATKTGATEGADVSEARGAKEQGGARAAGPVVYVALGDSTGVGVGARKGGGYVARLFERVERARPGSRVHNFCVSGAETGDVLRGQVDRVGRVRPTLVTLGVGINDLTHGVEEAQFARNYEEIVTRLRSLTDAPLVVTNLPDISPAPRVPPFLHEGLRLRIEGFNARIAEVAARHKLILVDAYGMSREVIPHHPEFFSGDGFHPSDAGYEYWAKMMWPAVKEAMGG